MGNVFFLWDGFKDYASTEFLLSVALVSTLWAIITIFVTLLIWLIFRALEWLFLNIGWEIKIEHLLLYAGIFILFGSLIWILKKFIWPNVDITLKLKLYILILGAVISIVPARFFYNKAEQWMDIIQKRITPFVWLFGIIVMLSIPLVIYLTWQEIQLFASGNAYNKNTQPLVTFVFDDNYEKIYTRAKPIFDAQGEVACAAIVLDYIGKTGRMTVEQIQKLQNDGWEILSHSVTHRDLTTLTGVEVENELKKSRDALKALGFKVNNLVYPFNKHNATVRKIARKYYRSARSGNEWKTGLNVNPLILRMYALSAVNLDASDQLTIFKGYVDYVEANNYWLIVVIHNVHPYIEIALNSLINYIQDKDINIVTINQALDLIGNKRESKIAQLLFILNNDSPANILRNVHIMTQRLLSMFQDNLLKLIKSA
jgi:peptidoglycan/xylan/chitin deacetylase (PgdA/CDA1 family)